MFKLVDLYQVCSYVPVVKSDQALGGHKFKHRNKEGKLKKSSSLKLEGIEL